MPDRKPTFVELCLCGDADPDSIDDHVGLWHAGDGEPGLSLSAYLGLSEVEYRRWAEKPGQIRDIIRERRQREG